MKKSLALAALSALANETRLDLLRLLVGAGRDGLCAGRIARKLGVSASGLSFHLAALEQAGLIRARRDGRFLRYSVNHARLGELMGYLLNDCCGGHPDICGCLAPDHSAAGTTKT